jgi:hypothetical protein
MKNVLYLFTKKGGCNDRDRKVIGFTLTYTISDYHHYSIVLSFFDLMLLITTLVFSNVFHDESEINVHLIVTFSNTGLSPDKRRKKFVFS